MSESPDATTDGQSQDTPLSRRLVDGTEIEQLQALRTALEQYNASALMVAAPIMADMLDGMLAGRLTQIEVRHLYWVAILDMRNRGDSGVDICRVLRLSHGRYDKLLYGALRDGIVGDVAEEMRSLSLSRLEWNIAEATRRLEKTGDPIWLSKRHEAIVEINRLHGLRKAVQVEVKKTTRIGVVIRTITDESPGVSAVPAPIDVIPLLPLPASDTSDTRDTGNGTEATPTDGRL